MEPHFFQLLDRIRFQAALSAIAREGKSLALISQVQALTDHYKEALLDRLQQDVSGLEVKAFFPADSDSIVQSFNQIVGEMPIAQALEPQANGRGLKIWVVHDASALPTHELRLLLELLEKFPGSRVRALLVYGGVETLPEGLTDFEKSLMRWIVDRPNFDQIKEALAQEQDPERAVSLRALIQRMVPGGGNKDAVTAALNSHAAQTSRVQMSPPPQKARWKSGLKIGMAVVFAMGLSIAVALKLHPDALETWLPAGLTSTISSTESAVTTKAVETAAVLNPATDSAGPASQTDIKPHGSDEPNSQASASSEKTPSQLITELPDEAVAGEQWAWKLKATQIIIQHGISPTYLKAVDLKKQFPDLRDAQIVPQVIGNESQPRFALITGPYESKSEAEEFMKSKNTPKYSWVRYVSAMQERLLPKSPDTKNP